MVRQGGCPRSSIGILSLSQGRALMDGRAYVTPDDVKAVAPAALAHRLVLAEDRAPGLGAEQVVQELLESVPVPGAAPTEASSTDGREWPRRD